MAGDRTGSRLRCTTNGSTKSLTVNSTSGGHATIVATSVADLLAYDLPAQHIDIAFIPEHLFSETQYHDHLLRGIRAEILFPMHSGMQPISDLETVFPNSTLLLQPYDSWVMPSTGFVLWGMAVRKQMMRILRNRSR